ncbi:MAG: hypothetical protein ABW170_17475 [Candidatus Thiodiazotropha sp. L084R]
MNWIHTNLNGKMSFFLGTIALLCIMAPTTVPELNDGKPGILNYLGNNLESTFTVKEAPSLEPEMTEEEVGPKQLFDNMI